MTSSASENARVVLPRFDSDSFVRENVSSLHKLTLGELLQIPPGVFHFGPGARPPQALTTQIISIYNVCLKCDAHRQNLEKRLWKLMEAAPEAWALLVNSRYVVCNAFRLPEFRQPNPRGTILNSGRSSHGGLVPARKRAPTGRQSALRGRWSGLCFEQAQPFQNAFGVIQSPFAPGADARDLAAQISLTQGLSGARTHVRANFLWSHH